jgi:hypothetical protein
VQLHHTLQGTGERGGGGAVRGGGRDWLLLHHECR